MVIFWYKVYDIEFFELLNRIDSKRLISMVK